MPTHLYLEPASGIAGDMFLSALASLADAHQDIVDLPQKLGLPDATVRIQDLDKNGIVCRHLKVVDHAEHSHDHDHSHSHSHSHDHEQSHDHSHSHDHDHSHDHEHSHHHHHRHLSDILSLIDQADIPPRAKSIASAIFTLIGKAESQIHNIPLETIHFHEVSGVDSIIDIVGSALLIDRLDIATCYSDPVCVGFGQVKTQHGLLPVPAPATAELLTGIPTYKGDEAGERCTPTGAAILRYLAPRFESPPFPTEKIAYGPGEKNFTAANVLRASLLAAESASETPNQVWVIETNLDDLSGESLGIDFQDQLLEHALDFHITPIQMKKGRPAFLLTALATDQNRDATIDFILENTTAIGLRYHRAQRRVLPRRKFAIDTEFGTVLAKETIKPSGAKHVKMERDSLEALARETGQSIDSLKRRIENKLQDPS